MPEKTGEEADSMEIPSLVSRLSKEGRGFGYLTWEWARQEPDKMAVICDGAGRTYGQMEAGICGLAQALGKMGLPRGSRAAIILPNCMEYLELEFACARMGITIVKINWRLSLPEIKELLAWNDVELVFTRRDLPWMAWGTALELGPGLGPGPGLGLGIPLVDVAGELFAGMTRGIVAGNFPNFQEADISAEPPDGILMHLHTSGTTGTPKCVVYTQEHFLAELDLCRRALGFTRDTVFQVMSQMYHAASIGPYTCLSLGGTVVMFERFQPLEYLRSIERCRVTRLSAIPTVLRAILDEPERKNCDLSSLKAVYYSTCPIPPGLIRQAGKVLDCDLLQSYGMTEMGSIVTILGPEDHRQENSIRLSSAGRPLAGCQVRIVDGEGRDCAVGQTGEILLRGPGRMREYYKMGEATRQALAGGWYHTGDVGWLDGDGYLYLTGRKSDLIISGGENIYPKEIEDVLGECPGVRESAVYGVPDRYWGEAVHASVIPWTGARLTEEGLREYCRGRLAGYKIPKVFCFRKEFPRNAAGKVLRSVLAREDAGNQGGYINL